MMNYKAKDLQEEILSLIYFILISERTCLIFFYIPPCEIFSCTLGYKIVAQEELEGSTVLLKKNQRPNAFVLPLTFLSLLPSFPPVLPLTLPSLRLKYLNKCSHKFSRLSKHVMPSLFCYI